jgi:hypothetical protein
MQTRRFIVRNNDAAYESRPFHYSLQHQCSNERKVDISLYGLRQFSEREWDTFRQGIIPFMDEGEDSCEIASL